MLQRYLRNESDSVGGAEDRRDAAYSQVVALVAVSVTGFPGSNGTNSTNSAASSAADNCDGIEDGGLAGVWMGMAHTVLQQVKVYTQEGSGSSLSSRLGAHYLIALLTFLMHCANPGGDTLPLQTAVLDNPALHLEDRVSFAASFLTEVELSSYMTELEESCLAEANISAILLTGLSKQGIALLQRYCGSSIYSAALLL